jgi:hypothetical protein
MLAMDERLDKLRRQLDQKTTEIESKLETLSVSLGRLENQNRAADP